MSNIWDKPEIQWVRKTSPKIVILQNSCVLHWFYFLVTMKDCKNRHWSKAHLGLVRRRKKKYHQQSEKVGLQLMSKSKVETMEPLFASLLWEPGAQNHLRSQTPLPRGHPSPLQTLSMFKSLIKRGETERQKRGLSYKTKSKRKNY